MLKRILIISAILFGFSSCSEDSADGTETCRNETGVPIGTFDAMGNGGVDWSVVSWTPSIMTVDTNSDNGIYHYTFADSNYKPFWVGVTMQSNGSRCDLIGIAMAYIPDANTSYSYGTSCSNGCNGVKISPSKRSLVLTNVTISGVAFPSNERIESTINGSIAW